MSADSATAEIEVRDHHRVPVMIALRYYRLMSRRPFIEVDADQVRFRLPGALGGRARWSVPISELAVVSAELSPADDSGDGWVFSEPVRLPYAATTTNNVAPNLQLLFNTPQRVPKLRYFGSKTIGLPFWQARRSEGIRVDGLRLRAVDPVAAVQALVGAGVESVDRPNAWLRAHHPTTSDPQRIAAVAASQTRWRWTLRIGIAAVLGVQALRLADHGRLPDWGFALAILALLAVFGLPRWAQWRDNRGRADQE